MFEARWSEVEWMIKKNIHKQKKDDDNIEEKEFVSFIWSQAAL